jgi:hypothetical protein
VEGGRSSSGGTGGGGRGSVGSTRVLLGPLPGSCDDGLCGCSARSGLGTGLTMEYVFHR